MNKKDLNEQLSFTDLAVALEDNLRALCGEAYAATKKPTPQLGKLIEKIEHQIAEYNALLEKNTGGRLKVIQEKQNYIERLQLYLTKLKTIAKKS